MRKRRIRRALYEFTGRSQAKFVEVLNQQLVACLDGARVAHLLSRGDLDPSEARERMSDIEHEGDAKRAALVEQLSRSIVTPIDREDLYRVSRSIDDVLDNLRDFVREVDLFGAAADTDGLTKLTGAVTEAVELMAVAIASLVEDRHEARGLVLDVRKSGGAIRVMYQHEVAGLVREDSSPSLDFRTSMRRRELLRRLDVVGLRLGEAADALADALVKRSF